MMYIPINEYVVAAKDSYIPVPCRGVVVALKGAFSETVALDDTVNVLRGAESVNLITVGAANVAEGVLLTGTPDTTYKDVIFDPASATAAHRVFKIAISALVTNPTTFNGYILFDNFAIVDQNS
jgi:hypothetical protein